MELILWQAADKIVAYRNNDEGKASVNRNVEACLKHDLDFSKRSVVLRDDDIPGLLPTQILLDLWNGNMPGAFPLITDEPGPVLQNETAADPDLEPEDDGVPVIRLSDVLNDGPADPTDQGESDLPGAVPN